MRKLRGLRDATVVLCGAIVVRLPMAILPLTLGPVGCGGGSSGSATGRASEETVGANGTASGVTVTSLGNNRFQIDFVLQSDADRELGVLIEYSENLGLIFQEATLEEAAEASAGSGSGSQGLLGTPAGEAHQVIWSAGDDLVNLNQQDLRIRVVPYDIATGNFGSPDVSFTFGIGSGEAPAVTVVSTPSSTVGGWVTFTYTVQDPQSDVVTISGQFSLDGGLSFWDATLGQGDGTSVTSTAGGTNHTILWNAQSDVPELSDNDVVFRIKAADIASGIAATSGPFSIRTYAPTITLLTVNDIPASMNGSVDYVNTANQSAGFTLLLPETNFVIWIEFNTHFAGAQIDPMSFVLTNSSAIGGGSRAGGFDPGENFGQLLTVDLARESAILTVPSSLAFPSGAHAIKAQLSDVLGNVSQSVSYAFVTTVPTAEMEPFDTTDTWHVDFSRDNFAITSTISGGEVTVTSTQQPNGISDIVEDLRLIGLNSASPPQEAVDAGLNQIVLDLVRQTTLGHLNVLFGHGLDGSPTQDSPNIAFTLAAPPGSFSRLAIGGDDPFPGFTIGRAQFDYRNSTPNNNSAADLGVFPTNVIDFYINSSFTFKSIFDHFIEGRGTPLGFHAEDVTVLSPEFDRFDPSNTAPQNTRYDRLDSAIDSFAKVIAVIAAHEIGHSIGLVANLAPSKGLFGGEFNASFAGPFTTNFHLDTPGNNIMAASISFSGAIATGAGAPEFNELNRAYMLERIVLD